MNPKQFLIIGGIVLVLVGILGFVGVLGPTEGQSIFGSNWWFDNGENWAHLLGGIVALIAVFTVGPKFQKPLVLIVGLVSLAFGILGFFLPSTVPNFLSTTLENPLDTLLHIIVGLWALLSLKGAKSMMMGGGM